MLSLYYQQDFLEAGCDEAGRGCLAGPVFAAAVILPPAFSEEGINDSKQLSLKERRRLRHVIEEKAQAWCVASVSAEEIDRINILNASILAMHKALEGLKLQPGYIIVDGNRFKPYANIPYACIVKGDARYASIAAASVLAKTHRDEYMEFADGEYPSYNWKQNKGYPTQEHRRQIQKYGLSPYHRRSFRCCDEQLKLNF